MLRVSRSWVNMTSIKGKVLIIDDEKSVIDASRHILEQAGFEVHMFHENVDSMDQLTDLLNNTHFDAVVTDRGMISCNGIQLARSIRDTAGVNQDTPIVMQTAFFDKATELEARNAGIYRVITKNNLRDKSPPNDSELFRAVNDAITEKGKSGFKKE